MNDARRLPGGGRAGCCMIIDCHCHAGKGDGLTGPWDTDASLERYLDRADAAGITHSVLFPAFHSDYSAANRQVAGIVARNRQRFIGFAFVHAERDKGRVLALARTAVHDYGFRGLKVHRHDARITREVCDAARRLRIPVLYDVMGETSGVELLASEYPDVPFVIPHLGSFADDWKAQIALIPLLERHANVFTDTSGVRRFDVLADAVKRAGAHKVLFGSDGPWLHPGVELHKVCALRLENRERRQILGANLLGLIQGQPCTNAARLLTPQPISTPRRGARRLAGLPCAIAGPDR